MLQRNVILDELSAFRRQLQRHNVPHQPQFELAPWIPVRDICVDWIVILLSVVAVFFEGWLAPFGVILIAHRQRALGNILHDAGHRNLHRLSWINDGIANLLVAPLLFTCIRKYRANHFLHHVNLGHSTEDPDYLVPAPHVSGRGWIISYLHHVFNLRAWWSSALGDLGSFETPLPSRLYILSWWLVLGLLMRQAGGYEFVGWFAFLWLVARGTVFHLITTYHEMCDHYRLESADVVSFSRDVVLHGLWSHLLHPRNNGYHLTHHLLPAVPYYRLPQTHRLIRGMPMHRQFDHLFTSYWLGASPVVERWTFRNGPP
jgi:fatty acid desaturase